MPPRRRVAERFQAIREWDGKKDRAFEELCFQLRDPTPKKAELIKTSAPDAGVEWYWRHADGTESGWQAKFIFDTGDLLDAMRDSLKTVVEKRKTLRKLTFCIPWDLADDPSRARGRQARERFDEARVRWQKFAPDVSVELLSGGQLLDRLAREENRGREWFFFNERILGSEWCGHELRGTIEDAGDRYTPQQNVDLPIDRILEATAQSVSFETDLQERLDAVLRSAREFFGKTYDASSWGDHLSAIRTSLVALEAVPLIGSEPPTVGTAQALERVDEALRTFDDLTDALRPVAWPDESVDSAQSTGTAASKAVAEERRRASDSAQSLSWRCRDVERPLRRLRTHLAGSACNAADRKALFVEGPAGRGKTHLFCDVGARLLSEGHPVVVLLGERFRDPSPWRTLATLLGDPSLSPDEVAGILAASGEAAGRRAVLFVDAINEAGDPGMWATELADLRRRLVGTGWVGFAVSCRSTYLDLVEPAGGPDTEFARVEHLGYRGREFEATERIFEAHGVQQPSVPLLLPEFSDPLFLKLYCEGVKDQLTTPTGSDHLSAVFERFVAARTRRIQRRLQLDRRLNTVGDALGAFAERLAETGAERLAYAEARQLINQFAPHKQDSPDTLIEALVSEGLLAIDRDWLDHTDARGDVVSFPYQRFSDHVVLSAFLERHLPDESAEAARAAFAPDQPLGRWLADASGGLREALAIQMPERWGLELPDFVATDETEDWRVRYARHEAYEAFVASLVVRDRDAFGPRTHELINTALNRLPEETAEALISVAPDPAHPYNGDRLHEFLTNFDMAERDAYWTRLLYDAFGDPASALDRLVRWAARGPYDGYPEPVLELASIPLVWSLASPNRFSRDYTTKALASALLGRPAVCERLVRRFAEVNDPYIRQRLAAAVLGATTRAGYDGIDVPAVRSLLAALVETVIESDDALPDALARDYVASLARWLRREKLITPSLLRRALPPYGSRKPKVPRSAQYLKTAYPASAGTGDSAYATLHSSALTTHSDWARYVVSSRVDDFLPVKLGDPVPEPDPPKSEPPRINEKAWKRFVRSLEPEQLKYLADSETPDTTKLVDSLDADQSALLDKVYVWKQSRRAVPRPMAFPEERAARFIFQRCIELGWTPERFGEFDASIGRRDRGRDAHKVERFGKKYQWIALFELLARLADNFTYKTWDGVEEYAGAWQLRLRDIDPTVRPEPIQVGDDQEHVHSPTFPTDKRPAWWSATAPQFHAMAPGQEGKWADRREDLPSPSDLLRVTDPGGTQWLIVDGFHHWRHDPENAASITAPGGPDRDLAIMSQATLIRRRSLPTLEKWLGEDPDLVRSLPDWQDQGIHEAFLSELPYEAPSHGYTQGWRKRGGYGRLPVESAAVSLGYAGESVSYDCSLTDGVSVDLPATTLYRLAGATWDEATNCWRNAAGRALAQYRETDEGFHRDRALMVAELELAELLTSNRLAVAVGLFCERRVFAREDRSSIPTALGWVDYVGHLIFDGSNWISAGLAPLERKGDHLGGPDDPE